MLRMRSASQDRMSASVATFAGALPQPSHQPLLDGITWSALTKTASGSLQPIPAPPAGGGPDVLAVASMLYAGGHKQAAKAADIPCEPLVWQLPESSKPHWASGSGTSSSKGPASPGATHSVQDISWGAKHLEPSSTIPAVRLHAAAGVERNVATVQLGRGAANAGPSGSEHAQQTRSQPHAPQQQGLLHAPNILADSPAQQAGKEGSSEGPAAERPKLRQLQARMAARHAARKSSAHDDQAAGLAEETADNGREYLDILESQAPVLPNLRMRQIPPADFTSRTQLPGRGAAHGRQKPVQPAHVPARTTSVGVLPQPAKSPGKLYGEATEPRSRSC